MSYLPLNTDRIISMRQNIDSALHAMLDEGIEFDAIVIRGMSGALFAHYVFDKTGKPIVVVRKGESSHGRDVEIPYPSNIKKYIILDDLVASGNTIISIKQKMDEMPFKSKAYDFELVAIVLYGSAPIESDPNYNAWGIAGLKGIPIFTFQGRRYHYDMSPSPEMAEV